jgi:general secretion pathway protein A
VGQNNVLIIDEAQNLSPDVLEQLRLMTNLETHERKLLQIILIGQPELRDMVAQPGLQQLAQRVIARFHLEALSEDETAQYIRHRLAVAGMTGPIPFPADSLKRIHRLCRGVPRRINLLCDRALLGAYAGGKVVVDRHIIDKAAREVFDASEVNALMGAAAKRSPLLMTLVLGMALGAVAWAGGNWLVGRSRANAAPVEAAAGASASAVASAAASAASASASAAESASASASATAPPPSASAAASAATRRPEAH